MSAASSFFDSVSTSMRGEGRRDLAVRFGSNLHALRDGREPRIGGERRVAHHVLRQNAPLAIVLDRDQDVGAVPGLEHAVGRDRGMREAEPLGRLAALVMQQRHRHPVRHRVEQRDRDRRALTGASARDDGFQHGLVGVHAGRNVRDRHADARGRLGTAGDRGEPALGLHQQVIGFARRVRAALAEARDRNADQFRVIAAQPFDAQSQACRSRRA